MKGKQNVCHSSIGLRVLFNEVFLEETHEIGDTFIVVSVKDTNFVIAAEREARRGITTTIDRFFATREDESFFITFTVAGELACGQSASPKRNWERRCSPYAAVLPWSGDISWQYGEMYRALAAKAQLIGTNDMSIATSALVHGMGVVTNNVDEFSRVRGLNVAAY